MRTRPLKEYIVLSEIYLKTKQYKSLYEPEDIITTKHLPPDMSTTQKYRWIQDQIKQGNLAELVPYKGYVLKQTPDYGYHA